MSRSLIGPILALSALLVQTIGLDVVAFRALLDAGSLVLSPRLARVFGHRGRLSTW